MHMYSSVQSGCHQKKILFTSTLTDQVVFSPSTTEYSFMQKY